jgi:hypothetical protein
MRLTSQTLAASTVAAVLGLAGCGSSSTHSSAANSTSAAATVTQAARATTVAWGRADTPAAICSLMSYGFKLGGGHGQSPSRCTSWVTKALGPFTASSTRIISIKRVGGQTAVTASFSGHTETLYLLKECGGLKVASINQPQPDPPPAPGC